jgi:hypothetical protein
MVESSFTSFLSQFCRTTQCKAIQLRSLKLFRQVFNILHSREGEGGEGTGIFNNAFKFDIKKFDI